MAVRRWLGAALQADLPELAAARGWRARCPVARRAGQLAPTVSAISAALMRVGIQPSTP